MDRAEDLSLAEAYATSSRIHEMATSSLSPPSSNAVLRAADFGFYNIRGSRTELARFGAQTGQSYHSRSIVEGPRGFPGYLLEGMYAYELEASQSMSTPKAELVFLTEIFSN